MPQAITGRINAPLLFHKLFYLCGINCHGAEDGVNYSEAGSGREQRVDVVTLSQPLSLNRRSWGQQQQQQLAAPQLVPPSMPFTARPSTAPLTALLPYLLVRSSGRKLNVPVFRLLLV